MISGNRRGKVIVIRYKLTDANDRTYGGTQWGAGITHETSGEGELCTKGWLHCYTHPLLAVLLNPIHADFQNPHLWEVEVGGDHKTDNGLKEGWSRMTTVRQLKLPTVTTSQRIAFAIICVLKVYDDPQFVQWALKWLNNEDRSNAAARAATRAATRAEYAAADAATDAAACAATHAARAATNTAANAAACAAAYAAADAARTATDAAAAIDLIAIAREAMKY